MYNILPRSIAPSSFQALNALVQDSIARFKISLSQLATFASALPLNGFLTVKVDFDLSRNDPFIKGSNVPELCELIQDYLKVNLLQDYTNRLTNGLYQTNFNC